MNETNIGRAEELPRRVARHAPGTTIEVRLLRRGKEMTVKATLDKLADEESGPPIRPSSGTPGLPTKKMLGIEISDAPGGVRVVGLSKAIEGLSPGDLIVEVDNAPVRSVEQLRGAIDKARGDAVLLKIRRGEHERYVGVPLGD